ncbi:NAD-dependent epimerase/dehydratase family protein [Methylonatrum kenyense]|uniref:NAD-dependent epimerase/dehydratase family protein n=1 Tax=Methylonatrum kenyense TaxID=455253 RepID=UPI0020C06567|nr:NAD-dependent epimerase/dehydratase family protein [Methylonatrum kenyense]MCK8516978.1 NAD-dependent epimerase/dehydratase family protein [Methylonatrum kenyense]
MKRVLITGANGFIGKVLVGRFAVDGDWAVRAGVRHPTRMPDGVDCVPYGDIRHVDSWAPYLEGVDAVVHLANQAHVMGRNVGLADYRAANVDPLQRLVRDAAEAGVRRLVYLSSIKALGERTPPGRPLRADSPSAPEDDYGRSKQEAEQVLAAAARGTALQTVVIRPPLVYGPDAPGNFSRLVRWVAIGFPLPLGAVNGNRRSLIGVDNLVDLIVTCLEHPTAVNRTFLASDGEDVSTAELLRRIASVMGRPARLVPVPVGMLRVGARLAGRGEVAGRLLDSLQVDDSDARDVLDWKPPLSLDEGLRRAVGNG